MNVLETPAPVLVRGPRDVPDLRLDLVGLTRPAGFAGMQCAATGVEDISAREHTALRRAELWFVGAEMCQVLVGLAPTIPAGTRPENLPPKGREVTRLVAFASPVHEDGFPTEHRHQVLAVLVRPVTRIHPATGQHDSAFCISGYSHCPDLGWLLLSSTDWPEGTAIGEFESQPAHESAGGEAMRRVFAALVTLLDQRLAAIESASLPRFVRRRSQRAGLPADVRVVYLRQRERPAGGRSQGSVEWSCRWPVRGHMRLQPCGPGSRDRRLTYVPTYLKGPEDKPLRIHETVQALVR